MSDHIFQTSDIEEICAAARIEGWGQDPKLWV